MSGEIRAAIAAAMLLMCVGGSAQTRKRPRDLRVTEACKAALANAASKSESLEYKPDRIAYFTDFNFEYVNSESVCVSAGDRLLYEGLGGLVEIVQAREQAQKNLAARLAMSVMKEGLSAGSADSLWEAAGKMPQIEWWDGSIRDCRVALSVAAHVGKVSAQIERCRVSPPPF